MEGGTAEDDEGSGGSFATLLFLKLEGEAGFVLAWGTQSVEKQEASRPAHPHGQLVPSDSCSPFLLATYNGSHPDPGHLENQPNHLLSIASQA